MAARRLGLTQAANRAKGVAEGSTGSLYAGRPRVGPARTPRAAWQRCRGGSGLRLGLQGLRAGWRAEVRAEAARGASWAGAAVSACWRVSLKTQELYALVFVTRYLDIFTDFISLYNTIMKLIFLGSSFSIVWYMRRHKMVRRSYDKDHDTFRHQFLILPCLILALLIHEKFTFREVMWTFSIYLEAVAIFPQLVLLQRTRNIDNLTGQYVCFLGLDIRTRADTIITSTVGRTMLNSPYRLDQSITRLPTFYRRSSAGHELQGRRYENVLSFCYRTVNCDKGAASKIWRAMKLFKKPDGMEQMNR
ncbi:hypothetical protein EJB05_37309, partial [Eragrostis curvula]